MMFIVKYIVCLIGTMLMYAVLSLFGEVDFIEEVTGYNPYIYALIITIILVIIEHIQN